MNLDALRSLHTIANKDVSTDDEHREEWHEAHAAYERLAGLWYHLLPLAEALEAVPCFFECPGLESECGNDKCLRCSTLKALQEAL